MVGRIRALHRPRDSSIFRVMQSLRIGPTWHDETRAIILFGVVHGTTNLVCVFVRRFRCAHASRTRCPYLYLFNLLEFLADQTVSEAIDCSRAAETSQQHGLYRKVGGVSSGSSTRYNSPITRCQPQQFHFLQPTRLDERSLHLDVYFRAGAEKNNT